MLMSCIRASIFLLLCLNYLNYKSRHGASYWNMHLNKNNFVLPETFVAFLHRLLIIFCWIHHHWTITISIINKCMSCWRSKCWRRWVWHTYWRIATQWRLYFDGWWKRCKRRISIIRRLLLSSIGGKIRWTFLSARISKQRNAVAWMVLGSTWSICIILKD